MLERWYEYDDSNIPIDTYEVSEIVQNLEGTIIKLVGKENNIDVIFGFVDSLRITDEGRRIRTYNEVAGIQKYRENFVGNPIYKVEQSKYVEWIEKESGGFCGDVEHYVIITENDLIDIISTFPPAFEKRY
ncbi:hypothetical protein JZO73_03640 [Enterococcus plantarum]|uniref:hypothetical protein n=1 Tax=Enterococcus plantarum TaxID=1077675 RepID=UPI001A8EA83F|nr:hypothetical protein [Enterococcus plantarum]MBO0466622.1 hypothetical protein [Enterococcus plantarum]